MAINSQQNNKQNEPLTSPVKILLADDSITIHRAVILGLKGTRFELKCVDNGEDALRIALQDLPQIVLADFEMPGLTGAELISALKRNPQSQNIKTVLLLSDFETQDEEFLKLIPSDARLRKPFEVRTLIALVDRLSKLPRVPHPSLKSSFEATEYHTPITEELTRETFKAVEEKTHALESNLREHDLSPGIREWSESELVAEQTASIPLGENLWGQEEPQASVNAESLPELTLEAPESFVTNSENFEVYKDLPLGAGEESELSLDSHVPRPPLPDLLTTESLGSDDFSQFQAPEEWKDNWQEAQNAQQSLSPSMSEIDIRRIVREELHEALRTWLKKELELELQKVIHEIDNA